MDKLRELWAKNGGYIFWSVIGLAVVAGLGCWFFATGEADKQFKARVSKIDGDFKAVQAIPPESPNDKTVEAIKAEHDRLKQNVLSAWDVLYKQQQEKNPWPAVLGAEFISFITNPTVNPGSEIPENLREAYQNFILVHLPSLRKLISVREPSPESKAAVERDATAAGGAHATTGRSETRKVDLVGVVDWDENDWHRIEDRYRWVSRPSSGLVWLAQEDLWVYEALLRIIKNVNEGQTTHWNAPIKRIEALEIAQDAAAAWQKAESTKFVADAPAAGGDQPAAGGDQSAAPPAAGGDQAAAAPATADDPQTRERRNNRYVDSKGHALAADAPSPFAEFKMMPIHMRLFMDQRRLPRLLVECANSNMPIEVRRLSINSELIGLSRTGGEAGGGGGAPAAAAGGAAATAGGAGEAHSTAGGGGDSATSIRKDDASEFDATVDLLGFIYMYNAPDRDKLGTGNADQAPAGGEQAPAAAGGAQTPAAAPTPGAGEAAPPAAPAGNSAPAPAAAGPAGQASPPGPGAAPAAAPGGGGPPNP